jgi:hypothetical protein
MNNINNNAIDYVKKLFSSINSNSIVNNSGTELGNVKSELLKRNDYEFIKDNDLVINKVIREKLYGQ